MVDGEIKDRSMCKSISRRIKDQSAKTLHSRIQNLSGYSKVKIVGKGAFGTAILYRRKDDDSLVILKEINMHDLTAVERSLALNEVKVLSMLHHPNIISFYDSFEEDGLLMIEMEYADGGTLAQHLAQLKCPLEEQEIIVLFEQIVSAINHMHKYNILHRDLTTANVFLTKEGIIKVGDFGASKMLTARHGAQTWLGTPYYISPEMCEGKPYNQKSDIWALGCILYEMASLQKTFEGSNLPAVVNKIVKGQFAPVRGNYSSVFIQLIRHLLQKDPDLRPTTDEIKDIHLPELIRHLECINCNTGDSEITMDKKYTSQKNISKRSVLYQVKMHETDLSLTPVPLPHQSRIKEVAVSTHMIVLTYDMLVFTWGDGTKGQLGHSTFESWRQKPFCVDSLKEKNITRVCAGEGFSVFCSANGIVMTCGDGDKGCLGHGDWNGHNKPKLIEKLLSIDVSSVSCGVNHVVVVSGDGKAYAWGCGYGGCLGVGSEENCCNPTQVQLPEDAVIKSVYCGTDGTMFVTDIGTILACGMNNHNKLGLNESRGFLMQLKNLMVKTEIHRQLLPARLCWLRQKVLSVSMGTNHTAILVVPGQVITFGSNKFGQLGRGTTRSHSTPMVVKSMIDRLITMVQCGDTFTVAGTYENAIYFWGGRQVTSAPFFENDSSFNSSDPILQHIKTFKSSETVQSGDTDDKEISSSVSVSEVIKIGEINSPLMREVERIGVDFSIIQVRNPELSQTDSVNRSLIKKRFSDGQLSFKDFNSELIPAKVDVVLRPQEMLALYASPAQIGKGEIVDLVKMFCCANHLYLVVDTTAPIPPLKKKKTEGKSVHPIPAFDSDINDLFSSSLYSNSGKVFTLQEEDSLGPIPDWLKEELSHTLIPGAASDKLLQSTGVNSNFDASHLLHEDSSQVTSHCNQYPKKFSKCSNTKLDNLTAENTYCKESAKTKEMQHSNLVLVQSLEVNRETSLENEIVSLKRELSLKDKMLEENLMHINNLESQLEKLKIACEDTRYSHNRCSLTNKLERSKICSVQ